MDKCDCGKENVYPGGSLQECTEIAVDDGWFIKSVDETYCKNARREKNVRNNRGV